MVLGAWLIGVVADAILVSETVDVGGGSRVGIVALHVE